MKVCNLNGCIKIVGMCELQLYVMLTFINVVEYIEFNSCNISIDGDIIVILV